MNKEATTIQRLTLMVMLGVLLVGFANQAFAQQDNSIDWSYQQQGLPPIVHQTIVVAPGEYILQSGFPRCGDERDTRVGDTAALVSTFLFRSWGWGAVLAQQGGAFTGWFVTQLQQEVAKGTSGSIAQFFSDIGASPRYATCGTVVLVAPAGWHFIDAVAGAYNEGTNLQGTPDALCNVPSGQEPYVKCHVPDAAWIIVRYPKVVVGTFINWARETRVAGLGAPIARD